MCQAGIVLGAREVTVNKWTIVITVDVCIDRSGKMQSRWHWYSGLKSAYEGGQRSIRGQKVRAVGTGVGLHIICCTLVF